MIEQIKKNPQSEEPLTGGSELGTDGVAALPTRLDRYGRAHQRTLRMADYASTLGERKLSARLERCGHWLVFRHYFTVDKLRLHAADFCMMHTLCPLCAIRRGAKFLQAYLDKLSHVQSEHAGLIAYFVTLTVADGPDLSERFNHLRAAMKRMAQARRRYLSAPDKYRHVEFCLLYTSPSPRD